MRLYCQAIQLVFSDFFTEQALAEEAEVPEARYAKPAMPRWRNCHGGGILRADYIMSPKLK